MSTPPEPSQQPEQQPGAPAQPTAYPYPDPQSPSPGAPGSFPPPAPPPMPGPQNLYGQPTLVGRPQPGNPYVAQGPYGPVAAPQAGGGGRGAGRAVLWAVVGALAASAAWAAGVFVIGGRDAAELRGYTAPSNLCSDADYSSFKDEYPQEDGSPSHNSLKDGALDESYCSIGLKKTGSSYADAYLTIQVDLHKKTDPGPEFTATWKNYRKSHSGYDVETVRDIGDEAYLVTQDTTSGSSGSSATGSRYATLAVRDGWMTYTMSYSAYLSTYDQDKNPPQLDEVSDWLRADTKATLDQLDD
ncbi:hypothetical protein ACIPSA_38385 [Streptomyces sp. NPDC086549]|uniref:hypothetical protein n=1 Tax=Streptomyces sp. NPDC086549 TaxID=3365752 RepID=UPI0037F40035